MTQEYKIQVSMSQSHIVDSGFVFKQGDFGFNVTIEVLDFDTTGATPKIIWRKSQGAVEGNSFTRAGNIFTYTMQGTELDTPGPGVCDLKLYDSTTKRISTASFKYMVEADTMDGLNDEAHSYSDTIAQIAEQIMGYGEDSEAWAIGTKEGVPVTPDDPQYHNNSKWYSEVSQFYKEAADDDVDACQDIYDQFINAVGLGTFTYDAATGNLYYDPTPGSIYTFSIIDGYLYVDTITP